MPKLIAILEHDPGRVEAMNSWLDDRLYMYGKCIVADPRELVNQIGTKLEDVLVLCLDLDSFGVSGAEGSKNQFADFLMSKSVRFPILIHYTRDSGIGQFSGQLTQKGWQVNAIGPAQGVEWVGNDWYPALKRSIHSLAEVEPVSVLD